MIKTAKLPQERFTTQGGRTHGGRTHGGRRVGKIFIILNLFIKNKAVCLGFLVIVARIKQ